MDSIQNKKIVGTIALATEQGLGYLARDFFNNGIIDYILIHEHSSRTSHWDWYPRDRIVYTREELLERAESFLFFETPFDWKIIKEARERKKKTALMLMFECSQLIYQPDILIAPSDLDFQYYPHAIRLNVPVDKRWKLRERVQVFVHNAGNLGLGGRNGTKELLDALKFIKSPIKLILRSQVPIKIPEDNRIDYRLGTFDDIWSEGDVFVFPEKFNGLSLPLQEAFASGMLVMATNRFPMNTWLPKEPLITVASYKKERVATDFFSAVIDPIDIAYKIEEFYNRDVKEFSLKGKEWAEQNSWKILRTHYLNLLNDDN